VPKPGGFVVKKGSKRRKRTDSVIPTPESIVRELHNVVERLAVLEEGPVVELVEPLRPSGAAALPKGALESLRAVERAHIERVLAATNWTIEGQQGAAATLGLAPSTLRARMRKLQLTRLPG
jgi:DNA-binding NtrC family response regulator